MNQTESRELLRELPPEHPRGLTFHLPLQVMALEAVHVDRRVIWERVEQGLTHAFSAGLVDPPLYRWAERAYQPFASELLAEDPLVRERAFQAVAPLGEGLAGAAFHGLIKLGYGALHRDPDEIARGLAYMRSRRQVLFSPVNQSTDGRAVQPTGKDLDGMSIFDQLSVVAGSHGLLRPEDLEGGIPTVTQLCGQAVELMLRRPDSFVAVHAVDALHALVELERLVTGQTPSDALAQGLFAEWWWAYLCSLRACGLLVDRTPGVSPGERQRFATLEALTDAAVDSCEVHSIKVVVALRRLVEFGIIDEGAALEAGGAKLGAVECMP